MKIPIEIITYILDFVDLRSVGRFQHATQNRAIDNYLNARMRSVFSKCMNAINRIKYSTSMHNHGFWYQIISQRDNIRYEVDYSSSFYGSSIKNRGEQLIIFGGKITKTNMHGWYLLNYITNRKEGIYTGMPEIIYTQIIIGADDGVIYIRSTYEQVTYD